MICLKFELIFPAVQNFYKNFLTRGGGVFHISSEGGGVFVSEANLLGQPSFGIFVASARFVNE